MSTSNQTNCGGSCYNGLGVCCCNGFCPEGYSCNGEDVTCVSNDGPTIAPQCNYTWCEGMCCPNACCSNVCCYSNEQCCDDQCAGSDVC